MPMQNVLSRDIVEKVEQRRIERRIPQRRLAPVLQMTQGHYSKIVSGKVPPGRRAMSAMSAWLDTQTNPPRGKDRNRAIIELAGEITMQCIKLARLMDEIEG